MLGPFSIEGDSSIFCNQFDKNIHVNAKISISTPMSSIMCLN